MDKSGRVQGGSIWLGVKTTLGFKKNGHFKPVRKQYVFAIWKVTLQIT